MNNKKRLEEAYKLVYQASERLAAGNMEAEEYELFLKGWTILTNLSSAIDETIWLDRGLKWINSIVTRTKHGLTKNQ